MSEDELQALARLAQQDQLAAHERDRRYGSRGRTEADYIWHLQNASMGYAGLSLFLSSAAAVSFIVFITTVGQADRVPFIAGALAVALVFGGAVTARLSHRRHGEFIARAVNARRMES